nr:coiled-coil domain-containing glutamate-rich protein 2 [Pogona vitticeps]
MPSPGGPLLLALCLCQALALPLTTQLPEESEKVTKCITEILADVLSGPSPIPVTKDCLEILREDERVLAVLHHQHLLTELEEMAHRENMKHYLGHEGSRAGWEGKNEEEEVKKRDEKPSQQREATSEKTEEQNGRRKEEAQEVEAYEKTEKTEEKVKEEKVSRGGENHEALEEQVKELMDKEKQEEEEKEEEARKRRRSSETWSSKEYFGHIRRDPGRSKIQEVMLRGNQDGRERGGFVKRRFRLEEGKESSEEEPRKDRHGGRHHEDWEEEEEEEEETAELAKRVAEKTSDEETAQFEEEEKGLKMSSAQTHLHGGRKPWQEEEEGGRRHGHHHTPAGLDLKKRHQKGAVYLQDRHHGRDRDEEERGASPKEVLELEKLEEIEQELKRAAEKLEELKRG